MTDRSAIEENLEQELRVPATAQEFRDIIEAQPGIWGVLSERIGALAEALDEQGGPSVQQTVAAFRDLAIAAHGGSDAAEQAALAFQEESRFWFSGDG